MQYVGQGYVIILRPVRKSQSTKPKEHQVFGLRAPLFSSDFLRNARTFLGNLSKVGG